MFPYGLGVRRRVSLVLMRCGRYVGFAPPSASIMRIFLFLIIGMEPFSSRRPLIGS